MEVKRRWSQLLEKTRNGEQGAPIAAVDRSWQSCKVLIAGVMVQGFIEGIPMSFGIFQGYYTQKQTHGHQNAAWIGSIAVGMFFLGAPLMTYLCEDNSLKVKIKAEYFIIAGWLTSVLALVLAAFCTSIPELIFTQGVLLGLSALFVEMPGLLIVNTWWVDRRGFAYGVLFSCTDIFGAGWAYFARYMLENHDLRMTFLIFALAVFVISGISVLFFSSRPIVVTPPISESDIEPVCATDMDLSVSKIARRPIFWALMVVTLLQAVAFYTPAIYLPTYNMEILCPSGTCVKQNTNLLAALNLAQIPGEFGFGWLSDHYNPFALAVISTALSGLSALFLWADVVGARGSGYGGLIAFALIFGCVGGGYLVVVGRLSETFGKRSCQMVYSMLSFIRGVGTIACGPLSISLLKLGTHLRPGHRDHSPSRRGYQSQYVAMIMCVVVSLLIATVLAAWGGIHQRLTLQKRFPLWEPSNFVETSPAILSNEGSKEGFITAVRASTDSPDPASKDEHATPVSSPAIPANDGIQSDYLKAVNSPAMLADEGIESDCSTAVNSPMISSDDDAKGRSQTILYKLDAMDEKIEMQS